MSYQVNNHDDREYYYDNLIIGGGPAGMSCGIFLRKAGAQCCVIEKALFPRDKTCGGLVTEKSYRLIRMIFENDNLDSLFSNTVSDVTVYDHNTPLVRSEVDKKLRLAHRLVFDNALVQKYKALDGIILENESGYTIDYANNRLLLANGDTVHYKYLIFADGFLSQSHKLINYDRSAACAFGIEAMLPSGSLAEDSTALHFGYIKDGYIWVFPYGDCICAGAAGSPSPDIDYKAVLLNFLNDCGADTRDIRLQGAFLPYGGIIPQENLPNNVLLAGDAGGFADPISGEGIYFALKTGMLAAQALLSGSPKSSYLKAIRPVIRTIKQGAFLRDKFYRPQMQKHFLDHIKGNCVFLKFFFDHEVAEYEYGYNHMFKLYSDYRKEKALSRDF